VTVGIRKFRIIVLVSNRIEYWSNYSIRNFEYSHSTSSPWCSWGVVCLSVEQRAGWSADARRAWRCIPRTRCFRQDEGQLHAHTAVTPVTSLLH